RILRPICGLCSRTTTLRPRRPAMIAHIRPAAPPPITTTSISFIVAHACSVPRRDLSRRTFGAAKRTSTEMSMRHAASVRHRRTLLCCLTMSRKVLIVTGDGGDSYEALFAGQRCKEAGWEAVVAAPSRRRLHMILHDDEPGWETYVERQGHSVQAD